MGGAGWGRAEFKGQAVESSFLKWSLKPPTWKCMSKRPEVRGPASTGRGCHPIAGGTAPLRTNSFTLPQVEPGCQKAVPCVRLWGTFPDPCTKLALLLSAHSTFHSSSCMWYSFIPSFTRQIFTKCLDVPGTLLGAWGMSENKTHTQISASAF